MAATPLSVNWSFFQRRFNLPYLLAQVFQLFSWCEVYCIVSRVENLSLQATQTRLRTTQKPLVSSFRRLSIILLL
jgi:hypothetical protein